MSKVAEWIVWALSECNINIHLIRIATLNNMNIWHQRHEPNSHLRYNFFPCQCVVDSEQIHSHLSTNMYSCVTCKNINSEEINGFFPCHRLHTSNVISLSDQIHIGILLGNEAYFVPLDIWIIEIWCGTQIDDMAQLLTLQTFTETYTHHAQQNLY